MTWGSLNPIFQAKQIHSLMNQYHSYPYPILLATNINWTMQFSKWGGFVEIGCGFKYDSMWGGWCSNAVNGSYRVGVWRNIRGVEGFL